jgi:hypothetical protein
MRRAEPVIEFVGLPGAGKSTITRALPPEWPTSRNTDPAPLPLLRRVWLYRHALGFMLSIRPLEWKDIGRLAKLAAELRYYERGAAAPLVIDQGMIQKLWSILLDRDRYSPAALERLVAALAPTAADLVVWLSTPPDVAAQRLASRNGGNSRLQKRPDEEMKVGLVVGQSLYVTLVDLYSRHAACQVLHLSGTDPVEVSAAKVKAAVDELKGRA